MTNKRFMVLKPHLVPSPPPTYTQQLLQLLVTMALEGEKTLLQEGGGGALQISGLFLSSHLPSSQRPFVRVCILRTLRELKQNKKVTENHCDSPSPAAATEGASLLHRLLFFFATG